MPDRDNKRSVPGALPPGYRFNEFEIEEVIGGGGFGIVYRAKDHQLERTIAIKEFMPATLAMRGEDMRLVLRSQRFGKAFQAGLNSFIQEARLLARFNHPNLLHVLRFWVQNDTAYMGTVFYSGTTLSRLREQHPEQIDEAWIRRTLPMLLGAVKTIHDEGCLHRDISLDNIQIQDNGLPVLLDFGSARRSIGNVSDETETMLRPGFAPIEQYTDDNESEQGPWTDIYALGAVLHTLIVGAPPPVSVVRSIQDSYQPLAELRPEGYSLPLLQAVDRALALHIEDRPRSVDEFAALIDMTVADVEEVASVKPTNTMLAVVEEEEEPEEEVRPAWYPLWQRYKLPGMVAAGVLVGLLVGGLMFGGSDAPQESTVEPDMAATQSAPPPPVAKADKPAAAPSTDPVARVLVRMAKGDELRVNDKPRKVQVSEGIAALDLPPGQYRLSLGSQSQTLNIDQPGTWLVNLKG
ncbi:serine/threonine protein kinase [Enterobacteriaceae bacterium BIT-l23]|uniref:serine/threonine protein kinase n=1 Tax=Jejubacter sp. L23 TaxID=3092086 RepID=UPI001584E46D|nr:serine/threonine protein kinase [Enterobacteriaceae bacterium BIT-l23]